ncbi:MAG: DJ-1/PfpI family protein, partial [Azonexus sp.]|nr:DJ-1/PfpI family protein [Azonexus sp.]
LVNVSADMAAKIANGLGMELPEAMPKVLTKSMPPEVLKSSALSLMALPGDGGIRSRKVAILVADGVHGASVVAVQAALIAAGAVACIVAPRLGPVKTADGETLEATATLENSPPVLFDALVLPDGSDGVKLLAGYGQTLEFITNQYRHGKTILALGASKALLDKAGIANTLASGKPDPGILLAGVDTLDDGAAAFIAALGKHRHPARETDPPQI